ncbi:cache domain-containing protein, partial [Bacillus sp. JJ722]|uniref:cache domain-containing protein n=1 Tax=Bacillus sp. JJ722 TaxID=3122973 RepID=UPI0030005416
MKSIRNKIIVGVTTIFLISFLTAIFLTNVLVKNQTEKIVDNVAEVNIELLDEMLKTFLKTHEESLNQLARNKTFVEFSYALNSNNKELASKLEKDFFDESKLFMKQYPSTIAVMFGSSNKQYRNYPVKNYDSTFDVTTRPWYTNGIQNNDKVTATDPYIDARTNEYVITLSKTMKYGDQTTGVLSIDISLDNMMKVVNDNEMAFKGEPFIINNEGLAIVHTTRQGEDISDLSIVQKILKSKQSKGNIEYELDNEMKMLHYKKIANTNWITGIFFDEKEIFELADNVRDYLLILGGIILVITVVAIGFISLAITRP